MLSDDSFHKKEIIRTDSMASLSSALFIGKREGGPASFPAPAPAAPPASPQPRRRRNQPGNPDPDAEVVALSPHTLMATNRFICEVCSKGFQREQNLQLHRRGHNLPWKLKQRSAGLARRKVYLCPEPSCIHHEPSRALGDLTGIKKHYSRKHGEKKFKCEKCAKKYAVQSDWKAHMKTCGTREYRCDCGTLFSRRDSFITHRAFCDALAQETAGKTPFAGLGTSLFSSSSTAPSAFRPTLLGPSSSTYRPSSSSFFQLPESTAQDFRVSGLLPYHQELQSHSGGGSSSGAGMFSLSSYFPGGNRSNSGGDSGGGDSSNVTFPISGHFTTSTDLFADGGGSSFFAAATPHSVGAHMSATALLQKAAMIGSSSSTTTASLLRSFSSHPAKLEQQHLGGGGLMYGQDQSLFASLQGPPATLYPNVGPPPGFGSSSSRATVGEGLTRDFLGMRAADRKDRAPGIRFK